MSNKQNNNNKPVGRESKPNSTGNNQNKSGITGSDSLSDRNSQRGDNGGSNRRRNRRKPNPHGGRKSDTQYKGNDMTWYQRVPNLLETAKQVAFNIPLGVKLKSTNRIVPGIIALDYIPIIGYCEPGLSNAQIGRSYTSESEFYDVWASTPFNIAMRNVFSKVRSSKGGSRPYDYPDLAQMILSAASIYAFIVHIQRVLKCVNRFNFENRYLGTALVNAQGYEYDDLVKNYVIYVGRLNLLIEKAKTVAIPNGLAVLEEWLWRNSNIFKDSNTDNIKQQFTIDVPNGFYIYDEAHGAAIFHPVMVDTNAKLDLSIVLRELESAVASLWNSETFAILMGDLRFAYKDNVTTIPMMGLDETVTPEFSLEHSIGVQNMNFFHTILSYNGSTAYTSYNIDTNDIVTAFTVHQDLRSAELNNGAIYAGIPYMESDPASKLRGLKLVMEVIPSDDSTAGQISMLVDGHKEAGFCDWSFINAYADVPDGEILVYSTRMKMVGSIVGSTGQTTFSQGDTMYYQILSSTACFWLGPRVLIEPTASSFNRNENGYRIFNVLSNSANPAYNSILLYGLSNFNIAPKAILYHIVAGNPLSSGCYILGDIEVGTDISSNALATLQSVCLYSQWLIPDTLDTEGFTPRVLTK